MVAAVRDGDSTDGTPIVTQRSNGRLEEMVSIQCCYRLIDRTSQRPICLSIVASQFRTRDQRLHYDEHG